MDVHLTVPDDLVVKASSLQAPGSPIGLGAMNVTLGGDIRATKAAGDRPSRCVGAVNTVRGTYDFQGRRFEILRDGAIRFVGEPLNEMDPALDIAARRIISGGRSARQRPRQRSSSRRSSCRSTPPLEQADILSLIVFNQPVNQLGEGAADFAASARAVAGGRCRWRASWRSRSAARSASTPSRSTWRPNGRRPELTVGQQVGQNLYLKVRAENRRTEPDQFHHRVRAHQVAPPPDQHHPGLSHSRSCSREWRAAASICCSSQLLAISESGIGESVDHHRNFVPNSPISGSRCRQRRDLDSRIVEAGAAAEIGERVRHERGAGRRGCACCGARCPSAGSRFPDGSPCRCPGCSALRRAR